MRIIIGISKKINKIDRDERGMIIYTQFDSYTLVDIEKELGIEIVGDTKVKIAIEEDEEPWDEIPEDVTDDTMKEIDDNVDPNYIKEEK